jgi:hypothetical protein
MPAEEEADIRDGMSRKIHPFWCKPLKIKARPNN